MEASLEHRRRNGLDPGQSQAGWRQMIQQQTVQCSAKRQDRAKTVLSELGVERFERRETEDGQICNCRTAPGDLGVGER